MIIITTLCLVGIDLVIEFDEIWVHVKSVLIIYEFSSFQGVNYM
jgi:hypothetical protein